MIEVVYDDRRMTMDPAILARLLHLVETGEDRRLQLCVRVVDDAAIHEANREHLGHDWATDVITFDLSDEGDPDTAGDILISAEFAEHEAHERGHEPLAELYFYVCHGMLHLCGYDDADPDARRAMLERQRDYLRSVGIHVNL